LLFHNSIVVEITKLCNHPMVAIDNRNHHRLHCSHGC
jgi:hypothetical protein